VTPEEAKRELEEAQGREAAEEVAARVWRVWLASGDVAEGRRLLAEVLDAAGATPSRARAVALYGDGVLAFRQGLQDECRARSEAALETARTVGDREAESLALVGLSRVAFRDGDYDRVRTLASRAGELAAGLEPSVGAAPLHMLAAGTRLAGHYDEAAQLYEESLELNRRLGVTRSIGMELHNLGHVELHRGSVAAAERYFAEADALRNRDDPYERAMEALNRAALACRRGDDTVARELLDEADETLAEAGITLDPDDAFEVDWLRGRISAG
jgi:tetratricopeptide (TPR) repeat protein